MPTGDQRRKDRIAQNEALFRAVNERIEDVPSPQSRFTDFLCECGNGDCTESLSLTKDEYEYVRSSPTLFVVAPGHVIEDVETVVEETERFAVVQKHPDETAIARATDPRSSR